MDTWRMLHCIAFLKIKININSHFFIGLGKNQFFDENNKKNWKLSGFTPSEAQIFCQIENNFTIMILPDNGKRIFRFKFPYVQMVQLMEKWALEIWFFFQIKNNNSFSSGNSCMLKCKWKCIFPLLVQF